MKKQLFALIFLPLMAFAPFDWLTMSLDDKVSVDFPSKPKETEMSGNPVMIADVDKDSRCMSMVMDFKSLGMDSTQLAEEMKKPESLGQFKEGILGQIPGSSLISEKRTTTMGYTSFEFVIDMGRNDTSVLNIMHNRNIFVGSKMYSLSFYEKTGKPQETNRKRFFNSLKIN